MFFGIGPRAECWWVERGVGGGFIIDPWLVYCRKDMHEGLE